MGLAWYLPTMFPIRRLRSCQWLALLVLASACVFVCTVAPKAAHCQATAESRRGDLIGTGKQLFDDQRYEESIQTLSAALLRPGASRDERMEVYKYLAYNYLVLSQMEEAEAAVRGLYVLSPDFTLPDTESPRFRTFFDDVMQRWVEEGRPGVEETRAPFAPPTIKHVSPAEWESGRPVRIAGQIVDPGHRAGTVMIRYRAGVKGKFRRLEARISQGAFRASIPGSAVKPPLLEYYIEAVDDAGLPVASRGDAAAPMRIAVPDIAQSASIFSSPWFWVAAAAVVAGGVTGAVLLTDSPSEGPGPSPQPPTSRVVVVIGN